MNRKGQEEEDHGEEDTRENSKKEASDTAAPAELSDENHSDIDNNDNQEFMLIRMFREEFEHDDNERELVFSDESNY